MNIVHLFSGAEAQLSFLTLFEDDIFHLTEILAHLDVIGLSNIFTTDEKNLHD